MPGQVQLTPPEVLCRLIAHGFKVFGQGAPFGAGKAFQVTLPAQVFQHIPVRAAAAVPITEGVEQGVDILLLDAVLVPAACEAVRFCLGIVVEEGQRLHPCPVQSFPQEVLIGEALAFRVRSQQFLRSEVWDVESLQQLGQTGGEAEGIRQPADAAFDAVPFPEPAFAPHQLPHQAFSGGDIGVALHIEGAFGQHLPGTDALQHPGIDFGRAFFQHFQQSGLAGQEPVFGILFHQGKLVGEGADGFVPGFLQGPQPGQVDMGLADQPKERRGGPVAAVQRGTQYFTALSVGGGPFPGRELEIHCMGEFVERFFDLLPAQAAFGLQVMQPGQSFCVHVQLVGVLVENGQPAFLDLALCAGDRRQRFPFRWARTVILQPRAVAGIAFDQQAACSSGRSIPVQGDVVVLAVDGPSGLTVYMHQLFPAQAAEQHDPAAFAFVGQPNVRSEPGVFPVPAPGSAGGHRQKRKLFSFLFGQAHGNSAA